MLLDLETILTHYQLSLNTVLHLGAHLCEERSVYQKLGCDDEQVLWIEANPEIAEQARKKYPKAQIFNYTVSNNSGEKVKFYITNNGQSSSLLKLGTHSLHHPDIRVIKEITVETIRLDDLFEIENSFDIISEHETAASSSTHQREKSTDPAKINLLVLDVQGVELDSIKSLGYHLSKFEAVYTEVNQEEVYQGCSLIGEIDDYLDKKGYQRVETKMTPHRWGDALYLHRSLIPKKKQQVAIHIQGGLGNQLFQLATLIAYCDEYDCSPVFDPRYVSDLRDGFVVYHDWPELQELIPMGTVENEIIHREDETKYLPLPSTKRDLLLVGYFNSERYFQYSRGVIRKLFRKYFLSKAKVSPFDGIGIHVRRGDYLKYPATFHLQNQNYYRQARSVFLKQYPVMVVSEDLEWSRKNIEADRYLNTNLWTDFVSLMTCQKGVIIANSTFSWWAAYLNPYRPQVIYPFEWFKQESMNLFSRYHVEGWQAVSRDPSGALAHVKTMTGNKHFEASFSLLSPSFKPVGLNSSQTVDLLDSCLIAAWYENRRDISKHCALRIVEESRRNLIRIDERIISNLEFALGDDLYQKVDLREIPCYIICRSEKRIEMLSRFGSLHPILVDAIMKDSALEGCGRTHAKALRLALKEGQFPFALFEDDVAWTSGVEWEFKIPKVTNFFYLGHSSESLVDGSIVGQRDRITTSKYKEYYRLNNMLGGHGILFNDPRLVRKCYKAIRGGVEARIGCDIIYVMFQKRCNCFTFNKPFVIQDRTLGGQEESTNVEMEKYLK